ncbi:MAG: PQQ-binding-like beta-propeller repeat protein [Alphaproteobacteria bacterium]|nr:PQQ-binding-like beta-propeller repeat protein [Alphaproteobacteria bacterium]
MPQLRDRHARAPVGAAIALAALSLMLSACAPEPTANGVATRTAEADAAMPGHQVYLENCASCHDNAEQSRAPSLASLRQLNRATVKYALELGYMQQQAKHLTDEERAQVIDWLPENEGASDDWVEKTRCPIKLRRVHLDGAPRTSVMFGVDPHNNRNESAEQAGLKKSDMPNLELAWSIAFPNTPTMRSQPVIVGDTIFIATTDSARVYALDTGTGCVKWQYKADLSLRSSLAFADATPKSPAVVLAGDAAGYVHAIDANTGEKAWVSDAKLTRYNRITGAPVVHDGKVITPVSAIEVNYAGDDDYECCKGQGALVAFDLATGARLWVGKTMEAAEPTRMSRSGTQQWGPSGAIIWSTPVIDAARNVAYAGTGESVSWPATDTSDSIIAYDLDNGERKWVFQATKSDIWNYACGRHGANCDWPGVYHSPDWDFGATSMLVKTPAGKDLVIAGQKSGVVWALDPDDGGRLVWSNRIGRGSANGGIHWGMAYDGRHIFAPLNDPAPSPEWPNSGAGVLALDADTGEVAWSYKPNARDCGADIPAAEAMQPEVKINPVAAPMLPPPPAAPVAPRPTPVAAPAAVAGEPAAPAGPPPIRCRQGMSPAPLLVDGALVTGTIQGMLRVFDGDTGKVLFEYQTNKAYPDTVNGVPGQGGGLDSAAYIAGDGTLFVQSGYSRFGEPPGNVLLAFRPRS